MTHETDPFFLCEEIFNRNMTTQSWLSGQTSSGMIECPMIKAYISVLDNGGTVEEAERAYWEANKTATQ